MHVKIQYFCDQQKEIKYFNHKATVNAVPRIIITEKERLDFQIQRIF